MPAENGHGLPWDIREPIVAEEMLLLRRLDPAKMPRHVAIIMDGNGRWARERGWFDRIKGHEAGITSVRETVRACGELGIEALSLYAFSVENWQRPRAEIEALMRLLERFLVKELDELMSNRVRLVASGRLSDLPGYATRALQGTMAATADNGGLVLNLALSYGGRQEILDAVRGVARDVAAGRLAPDAIEEADLLRHLYQPDLPDPDLLVRTSGEQRVSNFLLYEIAYTELYVTPVLWPDFRRAHLYEAIADFQQRERRFGRVAPA